MRRGPRASGQRIPPRLQRSLAGGRQVRGVASGRLTRDGCSTAREARSTAREARSTAREARSTAREARSTAREVGSTVSEIHSLARESTSRRQARG
ncbi:alanine-zipper protein [Chondromyces crocatus]|uniref:alanine-zipper protein n=1 Tax=Chondromyces crocatus TaxID=52 RepID=UPI003CCB9FC3